MPCTLDVPAADPVRAQAALIAALAQPRSFGPDCVRVERIETHISHVLLTGRHAYKIKKPVALGFLDFTTLAARRFYCARELELNRRLAPALYLAVVPITGTRERPAIGGEGPVLEYAVQMREFAQDALASRMLARGELTPAHIDALAATVADFHGRIAVAPADGPFGTPEDILAFARQNFAQLARLADNPGDRDALATLQAWTEAQFALRAAAFRDRRARGFIRECHGDLHLANVALVDGALTVFDCIEFNDHLRWIDVISEIAFATMDLEDRGRVDLAHRFRNGWLEATGDYDGVAVLRFYLAYRALVRAKVTAMRMQQLPPASDRQPLASEFRAYLRLAEHYARPPRPALIITHGFAGSGKTTATQSLVELGGALRVRTDVERKRLHGLPATAASGSAVAGGIYGDDATGATYRRVLALAAAIVDGGEIAIVDGTFLKRWQRDLFRELAATRRIPFVIASFTVDVATLQRRVEERMRQGGDASEADVSVLRHQMRTAEPLGDDERALAVNRPADAGSADWNDVLERLRAHPPT